MDLHFSSDIADRNSKYMQLSLYCKQRFRICEELKCWKQHLDSFRNDKNAKKEIDRTKSYSDANWQSFIEINGAIMIHGSREFGQ